MSRVSSIFMKRARLPLPGDRIEPPARVREWRPRVKKIETLLGARAECLIRSESVLEFALERGVGCQHLLRHRLSHIRFGVLSPLKNRMKKSPLQKRIGGRGLEKKGTEIAERLLGADAKRAGRKAFLALLDSRFRNDAHVTFERLGVEFRIVEVIHVDV